MNKRWLAFVSMAMVAMLGLAACGGDDDSESDAQTDTPTTAESSDDTAADAGSAIDIADAWARSSPSMANAGAAYMVITNDGDADDALLSAAVDASIAGTAEVHEVVPAGGDEGGMDMGGDMGDMPSETTMGGMGNGEMGDSGGMDMGEGSGAMVMQEVDRIDIAAGESVELKPGGYHVMLLDLAAPLEVGQQFTVTLTFESAGDVEVPVEVREQA